MIPETPQLIHPCGHSADFHESTRAVDHFICPECNLRWHIHSAPPHFHKGYWMPGHRTVIIETAQDGIVAVITRKDEGKKQLYWKGYGEWTECRLDARAVPRERLGMAFEEIRQEPNGHGFWAIITPRQ
jgi:hypothetical protein